MNRLSNLKVKDLNRWEFNLSKILLFFKVKKIGFKILSIVIYPDLATMKLIIQLRAYRKVALEWIAD